MKQAAQLVAIRNSSQPKRRHPFLSDSQHPMMQNWDWELNNKACLDAKKIRCRRPKVANCICRQCPRGQPHRWQATVGSMYFGSGCPCCSGRKACICNSLQSLYPDVAAEWDYSNNTDTPCDYSAHSNVSGGTPAGVLPSKLHQQLHQSSKGSQPALMHSGCAIWYSTSSCLALIA